MTFTKNIKAVKGSHDARKSNKGGRYWCEKLGAEEVENNACSNQASQQEVPAAGGDLEMSSNDNSIIEQDSGSMQCSFCREQRTPEDYRPSNYTLIQGEYRESRLGLFTAALNGDWKTAESIIKDNRELLNSSINDDYQTVLHVAAGAKQTTFVRKLVSLQETQKSDLELQDYNGNTAFCHAVIAGSVPIAKILMDEVPNLALIRGGQNCTPLLIAVIFGRHEMARLLYHETQDHLDHIEPEDLKKIFFTSIETDMFDIAFELLGKYNDLAVTRKSDDQTALHMLARKPSAFGGKSLSIMKLLRNSYMGSKDITALQLVTKLWKIFLDKEENARVKIDSPFNILFDAARLGNYQFLAELIRLYPELIWETNEKNQTIFHIAVTYRHVNIFNQIYSIGSMKDILVSFKYPRNNEILADNILHLAAKLPSDDRLKIVSGTALQMQRELLWFEEVKSIVKPSDREKLGLQWLTPRNLFSKEHKDLLEKSEKWMRGTSQSCMIVATLITTVVYSAAFSMPGGNDNSKGIPVHIKHILFHVFALSEAVALSFSITSTMMFLYILTSRYAEEDFHKSLPLKLLAGLATLFISMMAMIVAFIVAFLLAYRDSYNHHKERWVPLLISPLASSPAILFVWLQFPLLRDIFLATCRSHSLFRPKKSMFCFKLQLH